MSNNTKDRLRRPQGRLNAVNGAQAPVGVSQSVRRLEGDDLFAWASLQSDMRHLQERMQMFVALKTQEGKVAPHEGINEGGYILSQQQGPMPIQVPQNAPQELQESPDA